MANPITTSSLLEKCMVPVEPASEYSKNCKLCLKKHFDEDFLNLDKTISNLVSLDGAIAETIAHLESHEDKNKFMLCVLRLDRELKANNSTSSAATSAKKDAETQITTFIQRLLLIVSHEEVMKVVRNQKPS